LRAYASFEGDDSAAKQQLNQQLSARRLQVAQALIGSAADATSNATANGHAAARDGQIGEPRRGNEAHRVVKIEGTKRQGRAAQLLAGRRDNAHNARLAVQDEQASVGE
jgi:hypothetical protein